MKYIYKFLSLLTISVLMFSSYASYATGCCCVKGGTDKAEASKSEMPCHKNMADKSSDKPVEKTASNDVDKSKDGNCCSGRCDCKFTLSVKLPSNDFKAESESIEFAFIYFYTNQIFNSVSPESLDAPPKA